MITLKIVDIFFEIEFKNDGVEFFVINKKKQKSFLVKKLVQWTVK